MFQARIAEIRLQPGRGLKAEIEMFDIAGKAAAHGKRTILHHPGAGHVDQPHAAIVIPGKWGAVLGARGLGSQQHNRTGQQIAPDQARPREPLSGGAPSCCSHSPNLCLRASFPCRSAKQLQGKSFLLPEFAPPMVKRACRRPSYSGWTCRVFYPVPAA